MGVKAVICLKKIGNPVSTFRFLLDKADSLLKWQQFVNRSNWSVTKNSVICFKYFEDKFLVRGDKRTKLNWKLNPITSIHTNEAQKRPSTLRNPPAPRKSPKVRVFQEDELALFNKKDCIDSVDDLSEHHSPPGYTYHKSNNVVLYYKIPFQSSGFTVIEEAAKIDESTFEIAATIQRKTGFFINLVCFWTKCDTRQILTLKQLSKLFAKFS